MDQEVFNWANVAEVITEKNIYLLRVSSFIYCNLDISRHIFYIWNFHPFLESWNQTYLLHLLYVEFIFILSFLSSPPLLACSLLTNPCSLSFSLQVNKQIILTWLVGYFLLTVHWSPVLQQADCTCSNVTQSGFVGSLWEVSPGVRDKHQWLPQPQRSVIGSHLP